MNEGIKIIRRINGKVSIPYRLDVHQRKYHVIFLGNELLFFGRYKSFADVAHGLCNLMNAFKGNSKVFFDYSYVMEMIDKQIIQIVKDE